MIVNKFYFKRFEAVLIFEVKFEGFKKDMIPKSFVSEFNFKMFLFGGKETSAVNRGSQ